MRVVGGGLWSDWDSFVGGTLSAGVMHGNWGIVMGSLRLVARHSRREWPESWYAAAPDSITGTAAATKEVQA